MTSTGRCSFSATHATVAVFPVPVAPSSTVSFSPARTRLSISAIAVGWSPAGTMSVTTRNGATFRCRSVTGRTAPPPFSPPPSSGGSPFQLYGGGLTFRGPRRYASIEAGQVTACSQGPDLPPARRDGTHYGPG